MEQRLDELPDDLRLSEMGINMFLEDNAREKEQIIEFVVSCLQSNGCFFDIEEYYNKTFKSK